MAIPSANAAPKTTLAEYFPLSLCSSYNPEFQKIFNNVISEEPSALVLTCPIPYNSEHPSQKYDPGIEFCKRRSLDYDHYQQILLGQGSLVLINGTYDTTNDYPQVFQTALKVGKADKNILYTHINREGNILSIALPDMTAQNITKPMTLVFMAYDKSYKFPLTRETGIFENNSTPDVKTIKKITIANGGIEVVGIEQKNVVRHGKILGPWNGTPETISIELGQSQADFYAVIGQEYEYGPIRFIATTED